MRSVDCAGCMLAPLKTAVISFLSPASAVSPTPCPQKNGGCLHMTCRVCGHEWCWNCGRSWREHRPETGVHTGAHGGPLVACMPCWQPQDSCCSPKPLPQPAKRRDATLLHVFSPMQAAGTPWRRRLLPLHPDSPLGLGRLPAALCQRGGARARGSGVASRCVGRTAGALTRMTACRGPKKRCRPQHGLALRSPLLMVREPSASACSAGSERSARAGGLAAPIPLPRLQPRPALHPGGSH